MGQSMPSCSLCCAWPAGRRFYSGAGYAMWYGVVKQVGAQQAATMQLSVPVIAALGGVALALLPARPR